MIVPLRPDPAAVPVGREEQSETGQGWGPEVLQRPFSVSPRRDPIIHAGTRFGP